MPNLTKIEGVGPTYAAKMAGCGVRTTGKLLKVAGDRKGRVALAAESGVSEKQILEWVNRADLMRVRGVGEEYSDLLEASGVDTCNELKNRNAANLHAKMLDVNSSKKLVRRPPSLPEVERWVAHAATLQPAITH